jgi:hypothetical protein
VNFSFALQTRLILPESSIDPGFHASLIARFARTRPAKIEQRVPHRVGLLCPHFKAILHLHHTGMRDCGAVLYQPIAAGNAGLPGNPWRQPQVGLTIKKSHKNFIHSAQDGLNESLRNSPG